MAMGDVEIDYEKLCSELELQEQEVFVFCDWSVLRTRPSCP